MHWNLIEAGWVLVRPSFYKNRCLAQLIWLNKLLWETGFWLKIYGTHLMWFLYGTHTVIYLSQHNILFCKQWFWSFCFCLQVWYADFFIANRTGPSSALWWLFISRYLELHCLLGNTNEMNGLHSSMHWHTLLKL